MPKSRIIFFVFMLFLPIAFAETEIYSGLVTTDTDQSIEGGIFKFKYDEHTDKIFAQTPATSLIVDNGACKSNSVFKICINKANFSHRNITTYQSYYEVDAVIYKLTGSMTAASKSVLTELLPNEETEFTITLANPTDFEITGIKFNLDLTPFNLREVKGCSVNGNSLEWHGALDSKYDRTCTAKISSDKGGTYSPAGKLSYFNGYEAETKTTDPLTITVLPRQLKITRSFDNYTEATHPFYFNVSLENANSMEKLEGDLAYEFPGNINIIKTPSGFAKDFNKLKRNLALEAGYFLNFSFYLEPLSEGKYQILEKYRYTIKNTDDAFENITFVSPIEPKPEIEFISEYLQVNSGQKFIILVNLKNPSEFYDLTSIKATLKVPQNKNVIQSLSKLAKNQSYLIISNTFIAPEYLDPEAGPLSMNLSVEYMLNEIPKSLNKSFALNIGNQTQTVIIKAQPTANQSETATEAQSGPGAQQETAPSRPQKASAQAGIIEENLILKKFKMNFSDKRVWLVIGVVFIVIFAVPALVYNLRKKKKLQAPQPQAPQQPANPK